MFSGIVEEVGFVRAVTRRSDAYSLTIGCRRVLEDAEVGHSVAVNGVCLTVTRREREVFSADVMPETLRRTNLGELKPGSPVNLERALRLDSRLGGHLVSGHIDGVGVVVGQYPEGNAVIFEIEAAPELEKYLVPKGSVAVDGISLTVAGVDGSRFTVSIIPHTLHFTTMGRRRRGDRVNLEADMLAKYVEKLLGLERDRPRGLSTELLRRWGYGTGEGR